MLRPSLSHDKRVIVPEDFTIFRDVGKIFCGNDWFIVA